MNLKILSKNLQEKGSIKLPIQFEEDVRPDLIKRAVLAIQSHNRVHYGVSPVAGKRASAWVSKRRRDYRTCYGKGISRTPRKVLTKRGAQMHWVGAFAPNTVGGRRAHPPKSSKIWEQKINKRENRKAIRSALSASLKINLVKSRGHMPPANYPFVLDDEFESISKTRELKDTLSTLGFEEELWRTEKRKTRAGKGKLRGRKYKKTRSLLLVTSKDCNLNKAAGNISGMDVVCIKNINAELLAPGTVPGRLTLFTKSAIKELEDKRLFM